MAKKFGFMLYCLCVYVAEYHVKKKTYIALIILVVVTAIIITGWLVISKSSRDNGESTEVDKPPEREGPSIRPITVE